MGTEPVRGHVDLLLLQVLEAAPAHGYEIVTSLRRRSGGTFDLAEGTVYPALHRLEHRGLLASEWDERGPRRRRVYRITDDGRRALETERAEWSRLVRGVGGVLGVAT